MKQLVQLQDKAEEFKKQDAELIFIFREEAKGVEGLQLIKEGKKTTYRLALDLGKKSSMAYSPKKGTYDNYVIDPDGTIRAVIDGTLRTRAKAEEILAELKKINEKNAKNKR